MFDNPNSPGDDTQIVASIRIDEEEIEELLGPYYSEGEVLREIWREVDKINAAAPVYRMIRKVILRKTDFIHNTSSKLIRMAEENKAEE